MVHPLNAASNTYFFVSVSKHWQLSAGRVLTSQT